MNYGIVPKDEEEIDVEHLNTMRYAGKQLIAKGKIIGQPFPAYAWDYLLDNVLFTINNRNFQERVIEVYTDATEAKGDPEYLPNVFEIADAIDEWNMIVIQDFYAKNDYPQEDIEIILGNYIQEFSCLMEDWVESALQGYGYPYYGSSITHSYEVKTEYAPQNILLTEFLR